MNNHTKHFILLNLATASIATSGFLGKIASTSLPVEVVIFWRGIVAAFILFLFITIKKQTFKLHSRKDLRLFLTSGILFCGHLYFYFLAIQFSNVAIAVLAMFTFPIMTSLIEPFWFKKKLSLITVISAISIFIGMCFIIPEFSLNNTTWAVLSGLVSALCYTIRNLLSTTFVAKYPSNVVLLYQISTCAILLLIPAIYSENILNLTPTTGGSILLLALVSTAIGHNLFVNSFRYFSTSTASIITSLQPVVAIFYAYIFLNEIPNSGVYIGGAIIVLAVVVENTKMYFTKDKSPS